MQTGESFLYRSNDGQVAITARRVVLGAETWPVEAIKDVRIDTRRKLRWVMWLRINHKTMPAILVAGGSLILGAVLFLLALGSPLHDQLVTFAIASYVIAWVAIVITWLRSAEERCGLSLAVANDAGVQQYHTAACTWKDRTEATAILQAIQHATGK